MLVDGVLSNDVSAVSTILEGDNLGYWNFNVLGPFNDTLLHIAVSYGNYEMCKKLLNCNADVNVLNTNDETPLHIAEIKVYGKKRCQGKSKNMRGTNFWKFARFY